MNLRNLWLFFLNAFPFLFLLSGQYGIFLFSFMLLTGFEIIYRIKKKKNISVIPPENSNRHKSRESDCKE